MPISAIFSSKEGDNHQQGESMTVPNHGREHPSGEVAKNPASTASPHHAEVPTLGAQVARQEKPRTSAIVGAEILADLNEDLPEHRSISERQANLSINKLVEDTISLVRHNQSGGLPGGPYVEPSVISRFFIWLKRRFYSN